MRTSISLAAVFAALVLTLGDVPAARAQAQLYKGAQITVSAVERAAESRISGAAFWFEPGEGRELIIVRLGVTWAGDSNLTLSRGDVKLVDERGRKHDWRDVVTVSENVLQGSTSRQGWDHMKIIVSRREGNVYLDERQGVLYTLGTGDIALLFSVPRGLVISTLTIGDLAFDIRAPNPS